MTAPICGKLRTVTFLPAGTPTAASTTRTASPAGSVRHGLGKLIHEPQQQTTSVSPIFMISSQPAISIVPATTVTGEYTFVARIEILPMRPPMVSRAGFHLD
ncbi:hypothetical protein IE4872_PD01298 (plasmid) [Rhizobium gallicum]|uniref:Uncharacterized protein n=1 Tax=Rhizobium gallicum TaxID=56730 RepID=A0A1L5NV80_9HYPH|nr:hypothetical protein [Rhizobium gallicum]APO71823.1 hypothetical protein IE4872_PD01298 [Rhizobium gallicum]